MENGALTTTSTAMDGTMEVIDERWEYWTPDPEIAELMGDNSATDYDGLRTEGDSENSQVIEGYRFGRGDPDWFNGFKLAPDRRKEVKQTVNVWCPGCSRVFAPKCKDQRYCSRECNAESRRGPSRPCDLCGKPFWKSNGNTRFCSRSCSVSAGAHVRVGPTCLDWQRIGEMYTSGMRLTEIAEVLDTNRNAVRNALRRIGLYKGPGKSGPKKVIQRRPCVVCRVPFMPSARSQMMCSRECFQVTKRLKPIECKTCGVRFKPSERSQRYCGIRCGSEGARSVQRMDVEQVKQLKADGLKPRQIAERMGYAAVSVRAVLRKLNQQEQPRGEANQPSDGESRAHQTTG